MPKTSALSSDHVLSPNTDFFVFVDILDPTQAASGSTKKAAGSAVNNMVWGLSANYHINKIFPMFTVVNGASANWNAVYSAFALQTPFNASVYSTVNSNSATWGGGLTLFRELSSSVSPNNVTPVFTLSANSALYANIDVAIIAKGTGAILAQIPDGTATGGNKRGIHAVDLQKSRTSALEVASGARSVVVGGQSNRSTGSWSVVVGGLNNNSSGSASVVGGGTTVAASGLNATAAGGHTNTAGGPYSFVGGGTNVNAYGESSVAAGGSSNRAGGDFSFVGGGVANLSDGTRTAVCAGASNSVTGNSSFIGAGTNNDLRGDYSGIVGGQNNFSDKANTFLLGSNLNASLANYTYTNNLSSQGLVAAFGGTSTQWNAVYASYNSLSATFELQSNKGIANGYASLSSDGRVPYNLRTLRKRISLGTGGAVLTNAMSADEFDILTTSNLFLSSPSNGYHGQLCVWTVKFGGVHTVSLGNLFRTGNTLTWTSSANRFDKMGATYNAVDDKWDIVSFVANFPG